MIYILYFVWYIVYYNKDKIVVKIVILHKVSKFHM